MNPSQTFEILRAAGGIRAARIISEEMPKISRFRAKIIARKLRRGMPVSKIIRCKWFYGLRFYTNRHTLDPRPDTETLVDTVIHDCKIADAPRILDLGTGTGCIAISLAKNIGGASCVGVDKSYCALRVARRNVTAHNLSNRINMRHGDFSRANMTREKFDIIVSNPPYIARGDTRVNIGATYDPDTALYADHDGYAAYEFIAKNARNWIKKHGNLYLEIGADMGPHIKNIFQSAGWHFERTVPDLGGIDRVMVFSI